MSELQFFCPRCNQKIVCDELWSGQQLQCPSCQVMLVVPFQHGAAPAAPPPAEIQVAARVTRHAPAVPAPAAPAHAPIPSTPRTPQRRPTAPAKSGNPAKIIKMCVVLVVLVVAGYFGFVFASSWQKKYNEKNREAEANSDGGQVGHIANLYSVLDQTDPNNFSRKGPGASSADDEDLPTRTSRRRSAAGKTNAVTDLPLLPAVWTLDLPAATIPEGRANGMIAGTNFVVESARIDRVGTAFVLGLRQGSGVNADREILIYLRLNAGETLAGHAWQISSDMRGTKVPQVLKRWKPNPKFAPVQKPFNTGYVMKLQLGPLTDDETITGKIFIALPDTEKSVVAGVFTLNMEMLNMEARGPGSLPDF